MRIIGIEVGNLEVKRIDMCEDMGGVKKVLEGKNVNEWKKILKGLGGNEIIEIVDKRIEGMRWGFWKGGF